MITDIEEITFEASDEGMLSVKGMAEPTCRGDYLGLEISSNPTSYEVIYFVEDSWRSKEVVAKAYLEKANTDGDPADIDDDVLLEWLAADPENLLFAGEYLQQWLESTDLDEEDYEAADLHGQTPQGAALIFWRDGDLDPSEFGIVIVEGEFPGSSYYAAELRESIEFANETAQRLGVPVEFVEK